MPQTLKSTSRKAKRASQHPYVQAVLHDEQLRTSARSAWQAGMKAARRAKAKRGNTAYNVLTDKKVQGQVRRASAQSQDAITRLKGDQKRSKVKLLAFSAVALAAFVVAKVKKSASRLD